MSGVNDRLIEIFLEISVMLEILDDNEYRARAYARAARSLEKLTENICEIAGRGELERIPGVGKRLASQIRTWCRQGTFEEYEKLKFRFPRELFQVLKIPGLGPKKVKTLYRELGIKSLGELEYACLENRLVDLKGFGRKTQEKILKNIENIRTYATLRRAPDAYKIAHLVMEELEKKFDNIHLVGGLRRFQEVASDIDFLVFGSDKAFSEFTKDKNLLKDVNRLSKNRLEGFYDGFKIDLRLGKSPTAVPLLFYTGNRAHIARLQKIAFEKGLSLSSDGLLKEGTFLPVESEREVYELLGLEFIPPALREDMGEIEAAANSKLPHLLKLEDIVGVFHVHTSASDGSLSLEDVVRYALEMGYQYIGISDHSKSAFYAGGLDEERLEKQYSEIVSLREKYPMIDIYWGIESDILPDGSLDYSDDVLKKFDFVIGSVHSGFRMSKEDMTNRLVEALSNPYLTILGHPTGRLLLGRDPYEVEMEKIIDVAASNSKVLELNAHPHRLDLDWKWCKKAKLYGVPVAINPDAHKPKDFDLTFGIMTARKGWLSPEDVWNAKSRAEMKKIIQDKPWLR